MDLSKATPAMTSGTMEEVGRRGAIETYLRLRMRAALELNWSLNYGDKQSKWWRKAKEDASEHWFQQADLLKVAYNIRVDRHGKPQ